MSRPPVAPSGHELEIPDRIARRHRVLAATREAFRAATPHDDGRVRVGPRKGLVTLLVSPAGLQRALRALHAVFREAERRGWRVEGSDATDGRRAGAGVALLGRVYVVEVKEATTKVAVTDADLRRWERDHRYLGPAGRTRAPTTKAVADGNLTLTFPPGYWARGGRSTWADSASATMESKLHSIFEELLRRV